MSDDELENEAVSDDEDSGLDDDGGGFGAKKIILFVLVPLFILAGVGGGLYFTGALDGLLGGGEVVEEEHEEAKKDDHGDDHGKGGDTKGIAFLPLQQMVVNLASENGQACFLRLSVQLELGSEADKAAVESVTPRVIDQFQTYLRELRARDLRGSAGLYRLQNELLWRVNQAAAPTEVKDVLFQEILIQC